MKCLFEGNAYKQGPKNVPKSWRGKYSNFHNAGNTVHIAEGWLQYIHVDPDPDMAIDKTTYVRTGDVCTVQYTYRPYTKEELLNVLADVVEEKINNAISKLDRVASRVSKVNIPAGISIVNTMRSIETDINNGIITNPSSIKNNNRWPNG